MCYPRSQDRDPGHLFLIYSSCLRPAFTYHHSIERPELAKGTLALVSGLGVRRSRTGTCTSFTSFSAIDPNTCGYQPDSPCVVITPRSTFSRSIASRMLPATSSPTSILVVALT